ncbi:cupin domain-containing protein [Aquimarina sp. 2201CG14-23]|uniref:cupin domain-containing protein n=1 Tax=Aquimarina mycalae TaxID=3040073 RepID=UPI002477EC89|nr:cupin domain-containing protein [Aquimarina sp. 2201CG14-23]MDH7444368.1 cupin domain-containing protein [Aquimarina sp. 2201CG14-23]
MEKKVQKIVTKLKMSPHPEGGFYKETYRSDGVIPKDALQENFSGERNYCTAIYFLLTSENFSAFHRIKQDEIWHFYEGSSLYVHVISPDGIYTRHAVGMNLEKGESPQLVVPAGCWFASSVKDEKGYSFVGCTVSPGFDFEDFELAEQHILTSEFPAHATVISEYTRI